jgi:large subunit ribosomal protein L32
MPNPKRRHSKRRTALRRSHDFLTAVRSPFARTARKRSFPHRACAKCGEYKGRAVLETKEAVS